MFHNIKVGSAIRTNYYKIDPSSTIDKAITLMSTKNTSFLIVCTKQNFPVGILTERDIVIRVLSKFKEASKTLVEDVMSSPVRTCGFNTPITVAMRQMAKEKIRQLVVVKNSSLMGVFVADDAFNIAPELIDTLTELVSVNGEEYHTIEDGMLGYCEECEAYSNELKLIDGKYICDYCREIWELQKGMKEGNVLIY